MSIFKTIGNKLKRVVSLKNVISAATGNISSVVSDAKRVATTPDPRRKNTAAQSVLPLPDTSMLEMAAVQKDATYKENLSDSIASAKIVQDNVNSVNDFFTKTWIKATWQKNKGLILGIGAVLVGLVSYFAFFRKKPTGYRARKR